jgi:hypothetical protein
MSTSITSARTALRRRVYCSPAATKLTPEAARVILEVRAIPGDQQVERLIKEIKRRLESN